MTNYKIWLSPPHMDGSELTYVKEAFDSNWIAPVGPHITSFEKELSNYLGEVYCVALNSGTSAIHLSLILLSVQPGDEVICSTFTFAGSCNPIVYLKATPVFVDSDPSTWNIDPVLLEVAIQDRIHKTGKKPRAIIVVHLYGMPANMKAICEIANAYKIPVIEDAAEALGSRYLGTPVGTWGRFGVFSFNGNKIITTSGGGALVVKEEALAGKARYIATQARDPFPHYEHSEIGYNYRLSNVCAAIGIGQLKVLSARINRRRQIFSVYESNLKGLVEFQKETPECFSNRWLTVIYTDSSKEIHKKLQDHQIEARPVWKPMHMQPVFLKYPAYVSGVSEDIFQKGLCLPSGSSLKEEEQLEIIDIIKSVI